MTWAQMYWRPECASHAPTKPPTLIFDRTSRHSLRKDNVIDNRDVLLKDELLRVMPKTTRASVAVGYFFISGMSVIIRPLQSVDKVRLLISNTTDKITAESLIEGFHNIDGASRESKKQNHVNSTRKENILRDSNDNAKQSLEHMHQTSDDKKVVECLVKMMAKKQLEVRVYPKEKLHAKAYIFEARDTDFAQGMGIVGSSNLSQGGLYHNSELNLKTHNTSDVIQLLNWFDNLWSDGLEFTEKFKILLSESWAIKTYSPRDLFFKALYLEYKDKFEEQHKIDPIWGTTFPDLFPFQKSAVDQSLTMIELYNGVIIGDVVGLGKTYVGIAILKYLQLHDHRPLIICSPQLTPMWERFCVEYEVDAKILSRGQLSQNDFELSKDYRFKNRDLVLVDESHHFRNSTSRQYENLQRFMQAREAKAVLLTATPFSNNNDDIKNQLMLFHPTEKTNIPPAADTDLNDFFGRVKNGEANLADLLQNIMIRRTRRYVLRHWGQTDKEGRQFLKIGNTNKYFPQRKMKIQRYDIDKVYQGRYVQILEYLKKGRLSFARYSIGLYVKDEYKHLTPYKTLGSAGENLIGLIRTLLLKRMESSIAAFKKSIDYYIKAHHVFLEVLKEKFIPVGDISYKSIYDLVESHSDFDIHDTPETAEAIKERLKNVEPGYEYKAFDTTRLIRDVENDIIIFKEINRLVQDLTPSNDDKLHRLQNLLDGYKGKKVLIYSEFAATTEYLHENLRWVGHKDHVNSARGNIIECARKFDPDNNPSPDHIHENSEEISLLISTDVLSEGVNLQAGEVVINYDFHWNPTRLIQRAGRVDRIGNKNKFVIVHNFLLDPEIEKDVGLEESVDSKIDMIQRQIGEDYPILKPDEHVNTDDIYAIYRCDDSILNKEGENPLEPSRFEHLLQNIQMNEPKLWDSITSTPSGIRGSNSAKFGGKTLMACEGSTKLGGKIRKYYLITPSKHVTEVTAQDALRTIESYDESTHLVPDSHGELVALGWSKFIKDLEQVQARGLNTKLTRTQKWVRERLLKMRRAVDMSDHHSEIDVLLKAYSVSITRGKLNRELLKLKQIATTDLNLLDALSQLYITYDLQNQIKMKEDDFELPPKILYSIYVGDKI